MWQCYKYQIKEYSLYLEQTFLVLKNTAVKGLHATFMFKWKSEFSYNYMSIIKQCKLWIGFAWKGFTLVMIKLFH